MANERQPLLSRRSTIKNHVDSTPVYPVIHLIRGDVMRFIDTPLTYEALTAPDLTYTLIRPLVEKYTALQHDGNMSVVFCLLLNRTHFARDQNMASAAISRSRAALCEILAIQCLRNYGNDVLQLTLALTTSWAVYSGADPRMIEQAREQRDDDLEDRIGNAIEMAILGRAKRFIKSSSCQKVIDGIWTGRCVYQAESSHSILSDTYKRTPIHFYDAHKAPLLDHYRLKVPAIRSVLEYTNFLMLFIFFILAIELNERDKINVPEGIFMVYALGFCLEKVAAMQEHGIQVYFKGTWNGFDLAFVTTFAAYAFLRLYGVYHHAHWARHAGVDSLALIACLMFPRLAFVTLKDNVMVLALRAMIMQFLALMLIAAFCFCGFLYALWTLGKHKGFTAGTISWWMLDLWFGLDASGFDKATSFHPYFGPILMVTYACLSNTLLLTVLVSILSHTFSTINEDAAAEAMFRKAVMTIEGVKADSLFSYQPPVNLIAVVIMLPASFVLSPRWFHKVNVFMIRLTSFPILLFIAWYERQAKQSGSSGFYETMSSAAEKMFDTLPRSMKRFTFFEGLAGTDADIDAIFEIEDEMGSALETADYEPPITIGLPSSDVPGVPPKASDLEGAIGHSGPSTSTSTPTRKRTPAASPARSIQDKDKSPTPSSPASLAPASITRTETRARCASLAPLPSFQLNGNNSPPSEGYSGPRRRITSLLSRTADAAQQFTSPLAQIYQPLIVDDIDEVAEGPDDGGPDVTKPAPAPGPMGGISYGPASRRRLSSHARSATKLMPPQQQNHKFPSAGDGQGNRKDAHPQMLSSSPEAMGDDYSAMGDHEAGIDEDDEEEGKKGKDPVSAGKVEEEEADTSPVYVAERLRKMEERQKKTEELLEAILKEVKKNQ